MDESREFLAGEVELLVSRCEMVEIFGTADRMELRRWLGAQRVEGPNVSMSLGELIWEVSSEIGDVHGHEKARRATRLQARLLGLPVRDHHDRDPNGVRPLLGDALRTRGTFDLLFHDQPWFGDLIKSGYSPAWPNYSLRLEHRRYKKPDEPYTINPGRIGPNFVHTWALDLVNVKGFRIHRNSPNDISLYSSTWAPEDTLTIVDSCNRVLQTYISADFFVYGKFVDLEHLAPCAYDEQRPPYTRIYLILETSRDPMPGASRWFQLEELELVTALTGAEHAYVVTDEINYDYFDTSIQPPNNEDFVEALNADGELVRIPPPWAGGKEGANSELPTELKTKPSQERGWYLLGLNTTYVDQGFYSVVYYNERRALLRVYLYSLDEHTAFTAHVIRIYFEGCTGILEEPQPDPDLPPKYLPDWQPLTGAFFPLDANPADWWRAEVAVGGWSFHTWTGIEIPVLYPMGSNLPAVGDYAVGAAKAGQNAVPVGAPDLACDFGYRNVDLYRSMYEDEFAPHQRNVRLVLSVRTFQQGWADLDLVAKAVGEAVQTTATDGFTFVSDAIKTGKDWFGYGKGFSEGLRDALKWAVKGAAEGAEKSRVEQLAGLLDKSATPIGAIMAVTGFLLRVFGVLSPDVLRLNIVLSIQGKIGGTLTFEGDERKNRFYLPGRFSISDAFTVDGIAMDIRASVDSCLPRYDRTLGIFGYAHPPWNAEVNVNAGFLRLSPPTIKAGPGHPVPRPAEDTFFFPARHEVFVQEPWGQHLGDYSYESRLIPDLLPVVVNPQAEIDTIPAVESETFQYVPGSYHFVDRLLDGDVLTVPSSRIYLSALDRADAKSFGDAWQWHDANLPVVGQTRSPASLQGYTSLRVNVTSVEKPVPDTSIKPLVPRSFMARRGVRADRSYFVDYNLWGYEPMDWTAPAPMLLTDVIFCWKVTYMYWGETRAPVGQAHARIEEPMMLSSPIGMRLTLPNPLKESAEPW